MDGRFQAFVLPLVRRLSQAQLSKAMGEEPAPTEEEGTFWSKVDEAVWDFAIGSKEKKWNPDRRDDKTRVTPQNSTLSWGTIRPVTEDYAIETLEEMAEGLRAQVRCHVLPAVRRVTGSPRHGPCAVRAPCVHWGCARQGPGPVTGNHSTALGPVGVIIW